MNFINLVCNNSCTIIFLHFIFLVLVHTSISRMESKSEIEEHSLTINISKKKIMSCNKLYKENMLINFSDSIFKEEKK